MCGKIMTVLLIFVLIVLMCSMARYNGRLHYIVGVLPTCYKRKAATYFYHPDGTGRRLLEELRVALQGDKSYSWYENAFNSRAYKRLCAEFAVPPEQDWRQKLDPGCQGLGAWSTFMTPSGAFRHAHVAQGPFFHPKDAMRHNGDISRAWTTFVLDRSEGFTQAGVERLYDSNRT